MTSIPLFERIDIETQSNCNRSCWFCPRTYDRSGAYFSQDGRPFIAEMPTEMILSILDQAEATGFRGNVSFLFYSEPLLDERTIMLAHEAARRGMKPYLHTNGDLLKHDDSLCRLVRDAYEYIVVGLYDYQTSTELEEVKHFWMKRLAGADLRFVTICPLGSRAARSMGIPRALVPTDKRMAIPDLLYINGPCRRPLIRMIIRYDGKMCFCCEDVHSDFDLGSVYEHSLEELWYSARHVQLITDLIEGRREKYELCAHCPQTPTCPTLNGRKIRMVPRRYITE
jgi:radical SAM protein with 4Fe4S-binding SPASM domain